MSVFGHILFATDFSEHASRAFDTAVALARQNRASLTLLHVVTPGLPILPGQPAPPRKERVEPHAIAEQVRGYLDEHYLPRAGEVEVSVRVRRGYPSVEIIEEIKAAGADLVVMGSQGLSGMGLTILGSVADRVARKAPCSCLIVRPPQEPAPPD